MEEGSTEALLERVRCGDGRAVDQLLAMYRDGLKRFLEARIDPALRRRLDASDVVQNVCMKVSRRLGKYVMQPQVPLRAWLLRIAYDELAEARRHHAQMQSRSIWRESALSDRSADDLAKTLADHRQSASEQHLQQESLAQMREALETLSDADQQILYMHFMESLSYGEISIILDVEEPTLRKRQGRALKRLSRALDGSGGEHGFK